ncbi:reverse transcriptase domain-containing protein [Tanacetum coccineum]
MIIQSSVKDKILATSSETSKVENTPAEMLHDLDQQMEKSKANVVTDALSRKERVKPRRVRAMAMTIQYGVRGMILTAQSEAFKQDNVLLVGSEMDKAHASRYLVHPGADKTYYNLGDMYCLRYLSENEIESPWILSVIFQDNSKEWNSGDDQLRFRWMIYLVVLADDAESVRDAIRSEYCLASSSGWTKSPVLWAEIGESSLIGPERKPLEFEVRDRVLLKVTPWKGVVRFGKKGKLAPRILGGDHSLLILCGFGTREFGNWNIMSSSMTISGAASYAFSDSLLLTPLCCDDIHDVTPRVSALAGCDSSISINRGLIQAIPTSLPPQPIREATKASNLQRIPPGVQGRSHFTYFLYLIIQNTNTIFLDYRVTLGFGSTGGLDLACPINRLSCHDGSMGRRITNSLTLLGTDAGQLLRELHNISFSGGPTDNVVKHISNVLEIANIFNTRESTLLQQNFFRRFCPPAMIFKQLSEIQNFKQEDGESLFDTWERYNDLLFKCPFHDLNEHQKVNTFYNGLNNQTRRTVDTNSLIPGLTASDALKSIQKLVEHSHKWHCDENYTTTPDPLRIIIEKLKLLNHEMEELTVDFCKLNTDDVRKSYYADVKSIKSSNRPTNLKDKFEQCLKESSERQAIQNERMKKIMISTDLSLKNHDSSIKRLEQKVNHLAQLISTHNPKHTLTPKTETFGEKVKRRILEENKEPTATHDKPKQQLQKVVSHEIKESPTHYSVTRQNKLPPKETDPGSFILPCIIGNHSMSNALADLGASISIMPYSLFKRLGLGSLKLIKMTIKMDDRSMQSPKGIKENVLVKISNFIFPVDFVVLDIMKDENVPIILCRPMLATSHAKIDVYGKKISLGVGNIQEFTNTKREFSMTLCDPDNRMSIGLEKFIDMGDMWDDLDPRILSP